MNFSLITCDWTTHVKIVVLALVAGIVVSAASIHARDGNMGNPPAISVVKAGEPAVYSARDAFVIQ